MKPEQVQAIGAFLRAHREANGLSLRELEALSGVGNSVIARFETGQFARLDPDKLARLSRALGVSLTEVLAAGGVTSGADLPTMPVYLRSRYGDLPEEVVQQMDRYFTRLARQHGVDPDGPAPGEDEAEPQQPRKRRS